MIILYNNITRIIPQPRELYHGWDFIVQPKRIKDKSYLFGLYNTYKTVPNEFEVFEYRWTDNHRKILNQEHFSETNLNSPYRLYLGKNGKLYYRLNVDIHTADSKKTTIWFESIRKMNEYISNIQMAQKDLDLTNFDISYL